MVRLLVRGPLSKLHIFANSWDDLGDAFLMNYGVMMTPALIIDERVVECKKGDPSRDRPLVQC